MKQKLLANYRDMLTDVQSWLDPNPFKKVLKFDRRGKPHSIPREQTEQRFAAIKKYNDD